MISDIINKRRSQSQLDRVIGVFVFGAKKEAGQLLYIQNVLHSKLLVQNDMDVMRRSHSQVRRVIEVIGSSVRKWGLPSETRISHELI